MGRANRPDKVNDTGTENSTDYTTGGILTFSFHWFSPLGGRDKSFYTEHTDFDATKILKEEPQSAAFYHDMDAIAGHPATVSAGTYPHPLAPLPRILRHLGSGGEQRARKSQETYTT